MSTRKIIGTVVAVFNCAMCAFAMSKLNLQFATMMVTIVPIVLVYPFLQRYFIKGILVGAVKE